MSRIGKKQIVLPAGVSCDIEGRIVRVQGPKGELTLDIHPVVTIHVEDQTVTTTVQNPGNNQQAALWGTFSALVQNMVTGVSVGFERKLEITGVGYGWNISGQNLKIKAGYSHEIEMEVPQGVALSAEGNVLTLSGIDKQLVGETAARIRRIRTPEPYKGTGIKYSDEHIRRKAGKQAAGSA